MKWLYAAVEHQTTSNPVINGKRIFLPVIVKDTGWHPLITRQNIAWTNKAAQEDCHQRRILGAFLGTPEGLSCPTSSASTPAPPR
jgi:hypothetical protein